ncbi:MAG: metallophosphoesterase family protein [Treponema sp.]|nr:metallophosphoesterase family protein [Treponema sp.]
MKKIKTWISIFILMLLVLIFAGCPQGAVSGGVPYNITNNFAEDSSTGFIVQWHNDKNVGAQVIQIIEENESFEIENARAIVVRGVLWNPTRTPENRDVGNYTPRNIFRTEVTGLNPGTLYKYRIGSPKGWSETFYHLTSGGSNTNFSFTIGADTQDDLFNQMKATFRAANEFDADNRFFLIAGDISDYPQNNINEFPNYTKAANEFNIRTPIAATQGNHDTYLNSNPSNRDEYMFGSAEVFNSFIVFPENGWDQGEHHGPHRSKSYYFYYNNVLFIMLNTMASQNETSTREPNHTAQAKWLEDILQKDKDEGLSKYIIILTHIPFFAGRGSSSSNEPWLVAPVREAYGKLISDFNVDIVFSGHDHVYARSNPIRIGTSTSLRDINFNAVRNGTIFSIAGSIGPKIYTFRNPAGFTNQFIPLSYPVRTDQQSPGMFVNVKVTDEKLIVTAKRLGVETPLDTYEVFAKR